MGTEATKGTATGKTSVVRRAPRGAELPSQPRRDSAGAGSRARGTRGRSPSERSPVPPGHRGAPLRSAASHGTGSAEPAGVGESPTRCRAIRSGSGGPAAPGHPPPARRKTSSAEKVSPVRGKAATAGGAAASPAPASTAGRPCQEDSPHASLPRRHHHIVDNEIGRGQGARAFPPPRLLAAVAVIRPAAAAARRRHVAALPRLPPALSLRWSHRAGLTPAPPSWRRAGRCAQVLVLQPHRPASQGRSAPQPGGERRFRSRFKPG